MQLLFTLSVGHYHLLSVLWNAFLAFLPCWVVFGLIKAIKGRHWGSLKRGEKTAFGLIFLFWLVVFPNTAYLFTMPRHLVGYCTDYDINWVCVEEAWITVFYFGYALVGVWTFLYALKAMSRLMERVFGAFWKRWLPNTLIPLTSFGVMLGLFPRLNSWDAVFRPLQVLADTVQTLANPYVMLDFGLFTALLFMVYYGFEWLISLIRASHD
jgi:uncharacterized membrane protein